MPERLPVFPASPASRDAGDHPRLAESLFGAEQLEAEEFHDRVVARSGSIMLELNRTGCGIGAADEERAPAPIDGRGDSGPTPSTTRELRGCARAGCLEVARLHADYCPLHE
jgi:hypothetical protein